jgi:hypothetical protein
MKCLFSRPAILLVSVLLLLSACIPESKYPLPAPADGKGDDRLIGRWVSVEEDEKGYADIGRVDGGYYHVLIKDGPDDADAETEMDIVTTLIGGQWYMTIIGGEQTEDAGAKEPRYLIARYVLTAQGELTIQLMSSEAVAEDVRAGRVAGEVKPGEHRDDVLLTAESEALAAYIAAADPDRIFSGVLLAPMRRP